MATTLFGIFLWSITISLPIAVVAGLAWAIHAAIIHKRYPGQSRQKSGFQSKFGQTSATTFRLAGYTLAASVAGLAILAALAACKIIKVEAF